MGGPWLWFFLFAVFAVTAAFAVTATAFTVATGAALAAFALAHHGGGAGFRLVNLDGHVADDIFVDRGLALQLCNDASGGIDVQHHIMRFAVLRDFVGEAAQAPIFSLGYFARSEEHTSELQSLLRHSYAV